MLMIARRLASFLRFFFTGCDYETWNPPYPGDGI
jgi:hypothetical protein